jgi:hypothetical protein
VTADTLIDTIYGLFPDEFVRARDLAARELRAWGSSCISAIRAAAAMPRTSPE